MKRQHFDITGSVLSGFCFFHCLALPLLAGALPIGLGLAHDERVHVVILVLASGAAWFAFRGPLVRRDPRRPLALLAISGLTFLAVALVVPGDLESLLSVFGGLCLATAHLVNFAFSRRESHELHRAHRLADIEGEAASEGDEMIPQQPKMTAGRLMKRRAS